MKRYENILIASDLDGTFLGSHSTVIAKNIEAIRTFIADGGHFTFATGRHYDHLLEVLPDLRSFVNMPAIICNGACLYDYTNEKMLAETFMDFDITRKAVKFARAEFPRVGFRISTPQGFLTDGRTEYMQKFIAYSAKHRSYLVEVSPIEQFMQKLWHKVVFQGESGELDALKAAMMEEFGPVFEYNKSSETLFEIQKLGCSKGSMLQVLKKTYEVLLGHEVVTYGVGDYENDLALLQAADVAVCPANAQDAVKAVSDWMLCDHNEGVIADLISRL